MVDLYSSLLLDPCSVEYMMTKSIKKYSSWSLSAEQLTNQLHFDVTTSYYANCLAKRRDQTTLP